MGKVISLSRFRKQKERKERLQRTERNRVQHGRTKREKQHVHRLQQLEQQRLSGHELLRIDQVSAKANDLRTDVVRIQDAIPSDDAARGEERASAAATTMENQTRNE